MTNDLYCSTDGCGDFENNVSKILVDSALTGHTGNTSNPHAVTKAQVGLGNVDNTSDSAKPISTATQNALNGLQNKDIDQDRRIDDIEAKTGASALTGHTGNTSNPHAVTKAQVGLGNVDNTSDSAKPISTATQNALNGKENSFNLYEHTIRCWTTVAADKFRLSLTVLNQSATAFTLPTLRDYLDSSAGDFKQCSGVLIQATTQADLISVRGGDITQMVFEGVNRSTGDITIVGFDWMSVEVLIADRVRQIV